MKRRSGFSWYGMAGVGAALLFFFGARKPHAPHRDCGEFIIAYRYIFHRHFLRYFFPYHYTAKRGPRQSFAAAFFLFLVILPYRLTFGLSVRPNR